MVSRVSTLSSKKRVEAGIIRGSRDLYQEESYEDKLQSQIDGIVKDFEKKGKYDAQKLRELFDKFITSVENILKRLEDAKRNAESGEYKNLQELQQLISAETSIKISSKLKEIEERIFLDISRYLGSIAVDERRLSRNKVPRGYFLKKMRSDRGLLGNMRKRSVAIRRNRTESPLRTVIIMIRGIRGQSITKELETQIIELLEQYHENFERDLEIEVDIEMEEARKLHQIAKYIRFAKILKMSDYVTRLEMLMKTADSFVRQDAADSKKIRKIMARLFELSKQLEFIDTAQIQIFRDILVSPLKLRTDSGVLIGGTYYIKPKTFNAKGVLILPGILSTRKQFDLLSKRLAYHGYGILSIDLPSQAESHGEWRLGLISEFVFAGVRELRNRGAKKVTVIGHSAGAVGSMFAALSYNRTIETEIYKTFEEYINLTDELSSYDPSNPEHSEAINKIEEEIVRTYTAIKQYILASLKSGRFRAKINSFVLLAPPPKFQEVMPPKIARWIGSPDKRKIKWVIDTFINKPLKWNLLRYKNPLKWKRSKNFEEYVEYTGPNKNSNVPTFFFLRVPDIKDFMEYIANVKNPCDYAKLLNHFRSKSQFIRAFLDRVVRPIPKLFVYGKWDSLLKGFTPRLFFSQGLTISKKRHEEISSIYSLMGNQKTIIVPNTGHFLNEGDLYGINLRKQVMQDSRIVREILSFLDSTL